MKLGFAGVAELADAHGSGPCDSNIMRVQVPSPALKHEEANFRIYNPEVAFFRNLFIIRVCLQS